MKDADLLSELLGLPPYLVFDSDGSITDICHNELNNTVVLPTGYSFSQEYRIPLPGDYFLDLEVLTKDQRLIVYKAKTSGDSKRLIMYGSRSKKRDKSNIGFCLDTCFGQDGGWALLNSKNKIRVLASYVDISSRVAVVDPASNRILIVHVEEVSNISSLNTHSNRLLKWFDIDDEDMRNIKNLEDDLFGLN